MALSSSVDESLDLALFGLTIMLATAGWLLPSFELITSPSSRLGGVEATVFLFGILHPTGSLSVLSEVVLMLAAFGPRLVGSTSQI